MVVDGRGGCEPPDFAHMGGVGWAERRDIMGVQGLDAAGCSRGGEAGEHGWEMWTLMVVKGQEWPEITEQFDEEGRWR